MVVVAVAAGCPFGGDMTVHFHISWIIVGLLTPAGCGLLLELDQEQLLVEVVVVVVW